MKIPEVLKVEVENSAKNLSLMFAGFAKEGLDVTGIQVVSKCQKRTLWEVTVEIEEKEIENVFREIDKIEAIKVIGKSDRVFSRHKGGKIETVSRTRINSLEELRDVYTPGVARVCLAIRDNPELANEYTCINKRVAIVTDGTAILGLGDIGSVAGMPVMEGKAALFNQLSGLSGVPILMNTKDPKEIISAIEAIAPSFGAIQLEDISSPTCFEIEDELRKRLDIPVLHDDQHGTAVVALAALLSATKSVGKSLQDAVVGQVGLGAAGIGIARLLKAYGVKKIIGADLNEDALARLESYGGHRAKDLPSMMQEADVVVATTGVKGLIKPEWIKPGHLILALTNPEPEIEPEIALERGASFAADGKSINNVLGFPGLFKGVLDAGITTFSDEILIKAAQVIHEQAPAGQLVPNPLDMEVHAAVARAIIEISK